MNAEEENLALRISRPSGRKLVRLAKISRKAAVLDIGTGLGPVFFPALEKVGPDGVVVGVDISDEMVRGTRVLIKKSGCRNAAILKSDARSLIFRSNTFDVVLCGFSYIYSSPEEVKRVLKAGGRFGLSSWAVLGDMDFMLRLAQRHLPISSKEVYYKDTPETLTSFLRKTGFKNIEIYAENQEFVFKDEEQWWKEMLNSGWQIHLKKIEDLGGTLSQFKREAFEELQPRKRPDGIPFTMSALLAFGTKSRSEEDTPPSRTLENEER